MIKSHTKRRHSSLPYIFVLIFISGIIIGAFYARISPFSFSFQRANLSKTEVFKSSFINFLKPCFVIWLSGFCEKSLYLTSAVLAYRGGLLGFMMGLIFRQYGFLKGLLMALSASLPQHILYLPFLLLLCMSSANHKFADDRRVYFVMLLLSVGISAFSAFADTFITSFFIRF